ncbi:MAG: serine/threonine protein kinase [Myxococcaceae bacterium]|nr:MAG: serine/threonine protein kinase [Myxococcaceae bacterium]
MNEGTEEPVDDTTLSGQSRDSTVTLPLPGMDPDRRIGPYKLIRELGRGGMGTVWLAARADEQFEKRVALKVVRASDSEQVLRYFRQERQILAGLEHPNIARLLDGGTTEDGLPYFVMEHVEGVPIDRYCDEHKLPVLERLRLFEAVCSAVQHAHRSLVVHRDLKPSNILVTGEGVPKLLDFGIAKLLNPGVAGGLSQETVLAMTPEYASPEQVRGRAITTATDVYSLGVILYELLTGHPPYRVKSREHVEVLKAVCEVEPERPSTAVGRTGERHQPDGTTVTTTPEETGRLRHETPQRLRKRLKGDLDAMVMAALQKDPLQRYASVEGLARDIQRYLDGRPITARRTSTIYRIRKLAGRHKLGVAAAGAILALLVVLAVTSTLQASRIRKERDHATSETAKVTAMNVFLQEALGAADPWEKGSRNISLLDALRQAQGKAESAFQGQPLVRAAMLQTMGSTFANLAEFQEGEKALRTALVLRTAATGPRSAEVAESQASLANLYGLWHRFDQAVAAGQESLSITRAVYGPRSLRTAAALHAVGQVYQRKGDLPALKPVAEEMLSIVRAPAPKIRGDESAAPEAAKLEVQALGLLAAVALQEENYVRMEVIDRERLDKVRARLPELRSELASAVNDLATAQLMNGDLAAAEANYKEALAINIADVGEEHPETLSSRENLGNVYFRSKRYDETLRSLDLVLALRRKALGPDAEPVGRTLANIGTVSKEAGRIDEAERAYRAALAVLVPKLGEQNLDVASVRMSLGDVLRRRGQLDEAEPLMRSGLEIRVKVLGETHAATQRALKALADLATARGRTAEAAAYTARLVPAK